MRVTNSMMTNNTMRNVNKSKNNLYTTEQQMSSQKKISKPSDDPIVAIRALSLRTSLTEIEQYLKKNVPDADAWLTLTETSLDNMNTILGDVYTYCNQGSTDSFTLDNRQAIVECIDQLKKALYSEGNADYSGRYIFTGYRTSTALTFQTETDADVAYSITQQLSGDDFAATKYMKNSVDITNVASIAAADTPESEEVYCLRLAYDNCSANTLPSITVDGAGYANVVAVSTAELEQRLSTTGLADDTAYYVYDRGEVAFSADTYAALKDADDISITFQKDEFEKGDIRPEHYFDCKDLTNNVEYTLGDNQDIEYTINFSQTLKVNTRANEVLSYNIARDLDNLMNSLTDVAKVEEKIAKLEEMKDSSLYKDKQEELDSMLEAANKELDYAKNNMEALFARGMTQMQEYQAVLNTEISDIGSREVRLTLAKTRLTQQQTTFKDLKSKNEDLELEDITIEFAAAETVYDAAIATASKTVRQSLLDYL